MVYTYMMVVVGRAAAAWLYCNIVFSLSLSLSLSLLERDGASSLLFAKIP